MLFWLSHLRGIHNLEDMISLICSTSFFISLSHTHTHTHLGYERECGPYKYLKERQILSFEHLDAEGSGGCLVICRQLMLESMHSMAWMYWQLSMHTLHVHLLSARDTHTPQTESYLKGDWLCIRNLHVKKVLSYWPIFQFFWKCTR